MEHIQKEKFEHSVSEQFLKSLNINSNDYSVEWMDGVGQTNSIDVFAINSTAFTSTYFLKHKRHNVDLCITVFNFILEKQKRQSHQFRYDFGGVCLYELEDRHPNTITDEEFSLYILKYSTI